MAGEFTELVPEITEEDLPALALDATMNNSVQLSRIRPLDAAAVEKIYRRAMPLPDNG